MMNDSDIERESESINPRELDSSPGGGPVSCEHYADAMGSCQSALGESLPRIRAVGPFFE
jgi:hypothetical protein